MAGPAIANCQDGHEALTLDLPGRQAQEAFVEAGDPVLDQEVLPSGEEQQR